MVSSSASQFAPLLGLTIVQGWRYLLDNKDKWPVRIFVAVVVLLDIAESCCSAALLHFYLVENFGNLGVFVLYPKVLAANFRITGSIVFLVHIFFATRLRLLGKSWWYIVIVVILSTIILGLFTSISIMIAGQTDLLVAFGTISLKVQMAAYHVIGAVVDIMITIALCTMFSPKKTQFKSTQMILHQLLMYTITRGILILVVQIGHVIMYLIDPTKLLFWISLHLTVSKVYVLTTLIILNTRQSRRDQADNLEFHISRLSFAHSVTSSVPHVQNVN